MVGLFVDHLLTLYILYLKQDYHLVVNAVHCCSLLSNILPQYIVFSCLCQDIAMPNVFCTWNLEGISEHLDQQVAENMLKDSRYIYNTYVRLCRLCDKFACTTPSADVVPTEQFFKSVLPWLDLKQFLWWSFYGFIFDLFWNHISHSVTSSEINNVVMKFILSHAELYWSVAFWEDDGKTFRWYPRSYWVINTTIGRSTACGKTWIIFKKTSNSHVGSKSWHMRGVEMGR
jgi:hypothetical protein